MTETMQNAVPLIACIVLGKDAMGYHCGPSFSAEEMNISPGQQCHSVRPYIVGVCMHNASL
jgi:hypothetical protein